MPAIKHGDFGMDVEPVSGRLNFDDVDDRSPEMDIRLPDSDLSLLHTEMGKMDMADDSMISHHSCASSNSPDTMKAHDGDESGIMMVSPTSPIPSKNRVTFCCSTPAPSKIKSARRNSFGEVPRTPIKEHRFKPRISGLQSDTPLLDGGIYGIQEEQWNVNPFSDDADFMESPKVRRPEPDSKKRTFVETLSTPAVNTDGSRSSPESGYGSRYKHLKSDKVMFSLGSPSVSPIPSEGGSPSNRYHDEFIELETIGSGNFGQVTKVRKRLDGVLYSIKRTKDEVQKLSSDAVTEVFALAALGSHPNVLRYFSSWVQDNHLYIQSEYCDAGTLADRISHNSKLNIIFPEAEIRRATLDCAGGLGFLHDQLLVHLDVKPDNILMTHRRRTSNPRDCNLSDEEMGRFTYKIGDLGHVRSFRSGSVTNFMDGDRRYLAPEVLHDMHGILYEPAKADVYSLGITIYETARLGRTGWVTKGNDVALRNGIVPGIEHFPLAFNQLLQKMTAAEPASRPTMYQVMCDSCVKAPIPAKRLPPVKCSSQTMAVGAVNSVKPRVQLMGGRLKNRSASYKL